MPARIGELQKHVPVRSEILVLLERGAELTDVGDAELSGKKMTRLRMVMDNPERCQAEKVDLEKYARTLNGSAETEEGKQNLIDAIKKRRQLPEHLIHEFWLDPDLNYSVRRHEQQYEEGILLNRIDCTDFRKIGDRDLYLPNKITLENYTADRDPGARFTEPLLIQTIEMTDLKRDPIPGEDFVLDCKIPGQMIIDRRDRDHEQQFIVDENGERRALP